MDVLILMGDAAHATTPNMGQGASQAMEDAIVLVNCLEKYDFNKAIERYDKLRVKHTTKVIRRSKKIGKMAQKHHKLTVKLRNTDEINTKCFGISSNKIFTQI